MSDIMEKYRVPTIYSLVGVYACYTTLNRISCMGGVFTAICCALTYISFINVRDNYKAIRQLFTCFLYKILFLFATAIVAFCFTGSFNLYSESELFSYASLSNWGLTIIWVLPVIFQFINFIFDNRYNEGYELSTMQVLGGVAGIITVCLVFLYAFNPGITSHDSFLCMDIAHNLGHVAIGNWQPPFYIMVVGLIINVFDSIYFLLLIQIVYFAFIFMLGLSFLAKIGVPRKIIILTYLFVLTNYSVILHLITLWKDVPFMTSLLWLTILISKLVVFEKDCINSLGWNIQLIIALVLSCFLRQNGIVPVGLTILLLPIVFKLQKRIIASIVIFIACFCLINGPIYKYYNVVPVPGLKFFALSNDILYTYYNNEERDSDVVEMTNEVTKDNPESWDYNVWYTNYTGTALGDYSVLEFINIYIRAFIRNTKAMSFAILARNEYLWSVCRPEAAVDGGVNYTSQYLPNEEFSYLIDCCIPKRSENALTYLLTNIVQRLTSVKLLYIVYWRVGLYNILILLCMIAVYARNKRNQMKMLLPFIPIVANCFALIIGSGWSDYRYYWPSVIIGVFLLILTPRLCPKSESES